MRDLSSIAAALPGVQIREGALQVEVDQILAAVEGIKKLGGFMLFDITCVDRPQASAAEQPPSYPACFELAWRFQDLHEGQGELLNVRCLLERADPAVPSVMGIWLSADVLEREVWDLMGIRFTGREKLERILCRDDFEGHPLRKDFVLAKRDRFPGDAKAQSGEGVQR